MFFRWTLRQIDARYHAPVLITVILVGAQVYYGVLENFTVPWLGTLTGGWITSFSPTFLTILAAIGTELVLGRLAYGKWINPASAYVTGISAGILIKSPELWPFVLCAMISIASKYALRINGRHLWNPTNFGVTVLLLLAPLHTASLSVQYGNVLWANVLIWTLGALILWKIGKLHIPVTFAAVYLLLSPLRSWATGNAWADGGGAADGADVSALHVLHDYGPQDDDAPGLEPVPDGRPGGRGGDGVPAVADVVRRGAGVPVVRRRRISRCSPSGRRPTDRDLLDSPESLSPAGAVTANGTGASGGVYPRRWDQTAGINPAARRTIVEPPPCRRHKPSNGSSISPTPPAT